MRRGSILALLGIGLVAGGIATAVAVLPTWLPPDASRERGRIDFVFWFTIVICIVIFSLVVAVLVYSILKFRAAPDEGKSRRNARPPNGVVRLRSGFRKDRSAQDRVA